MVNTAKSVYLCRFFLSDCRSLGHLQISGKHNICGLPATPVLVNFPRYLLLRASYVRHLRHHPPWTRRRGLTHSNVVSSIILQQSSPTPLTCAIRCFETLASPTALRSGTTTFGGYLHLTDGIFLCRRGHVVLRAKWQSSTCLVTRDKAGSGRIPENNADGLLVHPLIRTRTYGRIFLQGFHHVPRGNLPVLPPHR